MASSCGPGRRRETSSRSEGPSVWLAQQQVEAGCEAGEAYDQHPYAGYDVDAGLRDLTDAAALAPAASKEGVGGEGERGDAYEKEEYAEGGGGGHR